MIFRINKLTSSYTKIVVSYETANQILSIVERRNVEIRKNVQEFIKELEIYIKIELLQNKRYIECING